ncbi:hypothetical protein JCM1840_000523 [Sporobolomyces johnsonii]
MLDRLPNELVLCIIELSVPSTFFSTTYSSRQTNLRNCCLVSRPFRQLAQALLFAFFQPTSRQELHTFLNATKAVGLGHHVKAVTLAYRMDELDGSVPNDLARLAQDCPALEQLSVGGLGEFNLPMLEDFKNLRSLTLSNGGLFASSPFVLPLLADLSLVWMSATPEQLASTFTSSTLPSLRALAFRYIDIEDNSRFGTSFIEPIETLCSQLHMLSMHGMDSAYLPDGGRVLLDHHLGTWPV